LLGGVFASSVYILVRKAGMLGVHTLQLLFSWCCFGVFSSLLFGFTLGRMVEGVWIPPPSSEAWWYIFGMSAMGTAAHALWNYAGRLAPAGLTSVIRSSDILWAYILEVVMFKEVPRSTTIAGVVLILSSLTMIAIEKFREHMDKQKYDIIN